MKVDVIYNMDCLKDMKKLPDNSVDLVATDPPYGISFMGKAWDRAIPPVDIWCEALRVLKPGAFAFVMSLPRQDCLARMIVSLEDAGFKIGFTSMYWAVASGFPKAQNISKAVDKRGGKFGQNLKAFVVYVRNKRDENNLTNKEIDECLGLKSNGAIASHYTCVNGEQPRFPRLKYYKKLKDFLGMDNRFDEIVKEAEREVLGKDKHWGQAAPSIGIGGQEWDKKPIPATPQAQALDGSYAGFSPKPAVECILVAMKPLQKTDKSKVDLDFEQLKEMKRLLLDKQR